MGASHNKRYTLVLWAFFIISGVLLLNIDVSIRQGIDGRYRYIHMPLYVKWTQFMARHYEYSRLASEITAGCRTDEEKALAVLKWTRENIKDIPQGMPLVDDHILTIIIKGYGSPSQFHDVFTTLCSYAGLPAFWDDPYDRGHKIKYPVSFVKIRGRWRVFDAYRGIYFKNNRGEIASVEDILKDPSIVSGKGIDGLSIGGIPYKDVYYNLDLKEADAGKTFRSYRQMPLSRIYYEIKKAMGLEKD